MNQHFVEPKKIEKSSHSNLTISSFILTKKTILCDRLSGIGVPFNASFRSLFFRNQNYSDRFLSKLKESKTLKCSKNRCERVQVKDQTKLVFLVHLLQQAKKHDRFIPKYKTINIRMRTTILISKLTLEFILFFSADCIELVRFFLLLSSNFIGMIEFVASALKWKSVFLLLLFALKKEIIQLCTRDYQINDDRADKYFFHLFKQNIQESHFYIFPSSGMRSRVARQTSCSSVPMYTYIHISFLLK